METEVAHAIVFDQAEDEMSNLLSMQTFLESRNHAGNVNSTSIQTHLAGIRQEKGQVLSKLDNVLQAADQHLLCQSELLHVLGACRDVLDAK